ncbi:MAG: glycosyltransferase family 4 protein [Bacteroidetes bacterium]|nr:glycosyltransferase family 4 protein [Bacteroidota bacterium]
MKLLILSQYFPPEVGAPQNRLFELAVKLNELGVDVSVLTAMPNYPQMEIYEGYKNKKYLFEKISNIKVHRTKIFVSKNKSIISRLRNYFSFVVSSAFIGKKLNENFDFLLCESPPLFLGYSAMYLAKKRKAKLIFNVSDLWPESAEKLGVVKNKLLLKLAYNLEKKLYHKSILVTGQTQGICKSIEQRFPNIKTYWLPNGVDLDYYNPNEINKGNWREKNNFSETDFIFLYAGIIGIAQGLEIILNAAKLLSNSKNIKFVLLGSGPEKERLINISKSDKISNVFFLDAVSKQQMPGILKSIDAAIIPLRKLDLFLGAIPSKIFETLSMQVPVILGVDGEARDLFINQGKCGLFFEPENVGELAKAINKLIESPQLKIELGKRGREFVNINFNRIIIAQKLYIQLNNILLNKSL